MIRDFDPLDYVDLSTIDANARVAGNQGFRLIGDRAFTGRAGDLSYDDKSGMLRMDVNGDRRADGAIHVANEYDLTRSTSYSDPLGDRPRAGSPAAEDARERH